MTGTTDAPETAPLSLDDGQKLLARFAKISADAQAQCAKGAAIEAELAAQIAPLKAATTKRLAPIQKKLDTINVERAEIHAKLATWWSAHRAAFLTGKKKSAEIAGCVIGTELGRASVAFAHGDEKAAVLALLKARLVKLLRRSPTLDKSAITAQLRAEPEGAAAKLGFSLAQVDTFFVEPAVHTGRK